MSGGRTASTPTPPQSTGPVESSTAQANGENPHPVTVVIRPDDRQKPAAATVMLTREPDKTETTLAAAIAPPAAETEMDTKPAPSQKAPEPEGEASANTTATALPAAILRDSEDTLTAPQEQAAEEAGAAPALPPAAVEQPTTVETPLPVAAEMRTEEPAPEREEEQQQQQEVVMPLVEQQQQEVVMPLVEQQQQVVMPLVEQQQQEVVMPLVEQQQQEVVVVVPPVEQEVVLAVASVNVEATMPVKELPTETNGVMPEPASEPASIQEPLLPVQPLLAQAPCEAPLESPIAQPEELNLPNGLAGLSKQDPKLSEEQPESDVSPIAEPEVAKAQEAPLSMPAPCPPPVPTPATQPAVEEEEEEEEEEEASPTQSEPQPAAVSAVQGGENAMQAAAVSIPKKKRKMKDLNKKETVGDLLDAFKESQVSEPEQDQPAAPISAEPEAAHPPAPEETDETWEEKEDKLDTENIEPDQLKPGDLKYKYKEEQWKPINPEEKKQYDREFLLGFQFIVASMQKPEGLPHISDVVLDKANKNPLRALDPSRLTSMNAGPDFTPSYANLGRQPMGGRGLPSGMGPRRSQQGQRKEPRKIIATVSLGEEVQLNKAEKAWKPGAKRPSSKEEEDASSDNSKTQELFRRVRGILNKLTPQMFQQLMKQVTELTIDTEERLKGVIDLIFEKAISEPNFSVAYANMCRCLMGLKVSTTDKPGVTVNFRKLLLNRCQKEFEKDKDDDEVFEKKQEELDAAAVDDEKQRLREELEEAKDKARRRSLGNIKFIGELFKLKMLTEPIMHDCIVKLLKNHDEESLECLCRLLSTIGKDLDFEKAKPRMDQYFNQMEKIIKEKKTSSRIRFMLQDVIDLRRNTWVPRRGDQGPKTIDQIHKEAELEEHREQIKVQQQLLSKKDNRRGGGGGGQGGAHPSVGRPSQPQDEGWNTVPISTKNRPIDTSRLSKITKPGALDFNNQLLAPGGRLMSWGKGSSGGSNAKPNEQAPESGRPATSTLNRFSALQQASSSSSSSSTTSTAADSDARRVVQRTSSSRERSDKGERCERYERVDRFERQQDRADKNRLSITKRSYSKEMDDRSREREHRGPQDPVRKVVSMTEDRGSRERERSKETVKQEPAAAPAPTPAKPALTEDEFDKKSKAIIEEYLHINDMKEALQCVQEMNSVSLLFVFVRNGIESTLERSMIAREHMGLLLHQLVKAGTLSREQYYKGLLEILEIAEDMEIDIPHIWLYLAELIAPMLHEGGIPMEELFKEVSKPLVPLGKAGLLLVEILSILCKGMSHKKAGALWREAGLSWKDFLPEDEDVNKFVTEKKVEFTLGDDSEKTSKKELSSEELCRQLDKLLKEKADNQRIYDWVEANLDEQQVASNTVIRAVMTSICQSAIIFENPCRVDTKLIVARSKVLQKYLIDEQKELQALYALQALLVKLEQPPNLLRMFFDALYDEDVIKEEAFYKWELSKDPAELQGKGVALKSVTAFFTWLREAEDESDN
ncbi:eukaryotic translation initiation factor 4 gamma 1-like [Polyodon spathula]|uniref:eukaryotic translation initiation factor 4 gamma 1-like n=1 Tax=Polyodon spathula TaxID=7913 RepID=UPI001B7E9157|nr:eukaryotic translation initiation factor 4 gamma 1-like [Polyodon spathula]